MTQLIPDWTFTGTKEEFEKELKIKFNGPGWYLTKTDTILVIPTGLKDLATLWHQKQPDGTIFEVNVYNTGFSNLIFAHLGWGVPNRLDERS